MKSLIKKTFLIAFIALGLYSCSNDNLENVVGSSNGNLVLKAPTDGAYVLTASTAGNVLFTVTWSPANYGYKAAVTYYLQVIKSTDSFDTSTSIGSLNLGSFSSSPNGADLTKDVKVRDFNAVILNAGGSIGSTDSFKIRILAKVNDQLTSSSNNLTDIKSQEATISVTPYDTFDEFDRIYAPGNYGGASTYADWNPANAPKIFSKGNDGKYEGFIWMNNSAPEFKFTYDTTWTNDKGDATDPNGFTTLAHSGNNIKPTSGASSYFVTVDWPNNQYTIGARQVAVIGAATPNGWGTPTYLTFNTDSSSPYYRMYTTTLSLTADEFLIRTKDDWSEKYGTLSGNTETEVASIQNKVKAGGGNMKVPTAGNYIVVFDARNAANYNVRLVPVP